MPSADPVPTRLDFSLCRVYDWVMAPKLRESEPGLTDVSAWPTLGLCDPDPSGSQAVGKPKTPKPVKQAAPARGTHPNVIAIRGSEEWKDWLEDFAASMRTRPTAVIDLALAKLAKGEGFREPPPRMPP